MKLPFSSILLGLAAAIGLWTASQSLSQPPLAENVLRWEYHIHDSSQMTKARLNNLGNDGWELVTIYQQNQGGFRGVFKRPK